MRDFQGLTAWQRAHQLSIGTYRMVSTFPREERFELSAQLRRAVVSVEANIAEGCGFTSDRQVAQRFQVAMAEASETQCELLLARDLGLTVRVESRPYSSWSRR
jgi:four helix bundle protein